VYYVEALMKEGGGGDHISVAVKLPSGVLQRPISNDDVYIKPPGNICVSLGTLNTFVKRVGQHPLPKVTLLSMACRGSWKLGFRKPSC
jgi:hypothetical protein